MHYGLIVIIVIDYLSDELNFLAQIYTKIWRSIEKLNIFSLKFLFVRITLFNFWGYSGISIVILRIPIVISRIPIDISWIPIDIARIPIVISRIPIVISRIPIDISRMLIDIYLMSINISGMLANIYLMLVDIHRYTYI